MELTRHTTDATGGTELEYHAGVPESGAPDRVIAYVHGLVSDVNWFRVPENLPGGTAVLFLPRQPRRHVDRFEIWTEHYRLCLEDFLKRHPCRRVHLVAQCFGTMPAMHWAMTRPETFDTITLAAPPVVLKEPFGLRKKLGILFGAAEGPVHCGLTPRSYGRSPAMKRFIESNPTTEWTFTNGFYREVARMRRWIAAHLINFPAPTHAVLATEDEVAVPIPPSTTAGTREFPTRTTTLPSDHFCEMLPTRDLFWKSVFDFQLEHEDPFGSDPDVRTVLVTGATGFLGSHILRRLHADGRHVIAYARTPSKAEQKFAELGERFEVRRGDLNDLDAFAEAMRGVDCVVHTAGHVTDWDRYENFLETNVTGTQNALMLAHEAGVGQFVHISSLGVFGDIDQDNFDENHMYRLSSDHYSNSKIHAEIAVKKYCTANRVPFSVVRPGFIYGEGDNNFFPKLIENLRAGKAKYIGSRDNFVNTVYVGNVAELVASIVGNRSAFGETYNIGDPQPTTIHEFFEAVCARLGISPPQKVVPKRVALTAAAVFETIFRALRVPNAPPLTRKKVTFVARSRSVDAGKAWALIGRQPFSAEEGLRRTLEAMDA
jgi:nucleoside-diphosphate-sugar epimerase